MQDNVKKKFNQDSYTAQFIPNKSRFNKKHRREHCLANHSQIKMIGRDKGQQVRIERPTANGITCALYTVKGVYDKEDPDTVFVGYSKPEDLCDRLELCDEYSSTDAFTGRVKAQVTAVGLNDAEAKKRDEFIEHLTDNGHNCALAVIAPHGGNIEKYTDKQAEHVRKQLSSKYASAWICKGFKNPIGAFDRWHITSTDISEESFPKLKMIMPPRRRFEYCIAFHGWDDKKNVICIGGRKSQYLKQQIKMEIEKVVLGSGIDVATDEDKDGKCPEEFNGSHRNNIVNRLGKKGVQIEQSEKAREEYYIEIADAVAGAIRPIIQV
jgi:phage replication-related protein YjqB (UPF0714/DUF867 family)